MTSNSIKELEEKLKVAKLKDQLRKHGISDEIKTIEKKEGKKEHSHENKMFKEITKLEHERKKISSETPKTFLDKTNRLLRLAHVHKAIGDRKQYIRKEQALKQVEQNIKLTKINTELKKAQEEYKNQAKKSHLSIEDLYKLPSGY
jgi:hypothetical protein